VSIFLWLYLFQLPSSAPFYTQESLVNAASQTLDRVAPNSILTLYGTNLSFFEGPSLRILRGATRLPIFYISPGQVNFLMPANTAEGLHFIQVTRSGTVGPRISVLVREQAPELFMTPENWLLATRPGGKLITAADPARPGDTIVFYGTGFGPVISTSKGAAGNLDWLEFITEFNVQVNGQPMPGLHFAGGAPTFEGLYQVNYTLPAIAEENPEIRVSARGDRSRAGTRLWFRP